MKQGLSLEASDKLGTWKLKQHQWDQAKLTIILNNCFILQTEEMGNFCVGTHRTDIKSTMKMGEGNLKSLKLIKRLKANKFSTICLVYSESSQTLRALKVTDKVKLCKGNCMDLPIHEQKILSQLHHPLLVNIVSAFQDEDSLYILLEYMPYGSLRDLINSEGLLPQEHVRFAARCIFFALQYLHSKGIAHFDIKPQNILIDRKRYLRLCDFNLSQEISSLNSDSRIKGTPGYKPPQNMDKNYKIGFEADFYSAGVVLFELLTGKNIPTPSGADSEEIVDKLMKVPNISNNCVDFLLQLMERTPSKRLGAKGIGEILGHPWIAMEDKQKNMFKQKSLPSFISDSYTSKFQYVKELYQNGDHHHQHHSLSRIGHCHDDEFVRSVYLQDPRFQKMFAGFKTIHEHEEQSKQRLMV